MDARLKKGVHHQKSILNELNNFSSSIDKVSLKKQHFSGPCSFGEVVHKSANIKIVKKFIPFLVQVLNHMADTNSKDDWAVIYQSAQP